ncbi:hypothetical protein [Salipaludibacillus neizhouensis]|nr:hypothetical protein [Salipaludibacillus neizhouensis]
MATFLRTVPGTVRNGSKYNLEENIKRQNKWLKLPMQWEYR